MINLTKFIDKLTYSHFYVDIIAFVVASFSLIIGWSEMEIYIRLAYILFIGMCLHQLEEYRWPGGFVWGYNTIQKSDKPDRYPGNRLSASLIDVVSLILGGYFLFWNCTAVVSAVFAMFALIEVVVHIGFGSIMLKKFRSKGKETIYFPGNATSWFIFAPFGAATLYELITNNLLIAMGWIQSILYLILFLLFIVLLPQKLFKNPNTHYAYKTKPIEGYFKKFMD